MSLDAYIQACEERFAGDDEYRARLQRELFDTDSRRSIQQTLETLRFGASLRKRTA